MNEMVEDLTYFKSMCLNFIDEMYVQSQIEHQRTQAFEVSPQTLQFHITL
jgi:hypothetical protein